MKMYDICGILNVYKEKDYTSHDVVAVVRKTLGGVKTGHTGTLDPQAEGVLPVCVGKATKLSDMLAAQRKGYRAVVILGAETDTQDATGTILARREITADERDIQAVVDSFLGEQDQTPPMYSALKVGGRKLYELARAGVVVERKSRSVTIYDIAVAEFLPGGRFVLDVECSKGTYIRSLCASIGEKLGCGGHMGDLLRTRTGGFCLEESHKLADIKQAVADGRLDGVLIPVDLALPGIKKGYVDADADKLLRNGNKISARFVEDSHEPLNPGGDALLYDCEGRLAGLYTLCETDEERFFKPKVMLY